MIFLHKQGTRKGKTVKALAVFGLIAGAMIASGRDLIWTGSASSVTGVRGTFSPDGRKIAFQRMVGGDIHLGILSLDDGRVEWVERSSGQAVFPFWAKDGRLVYSFGTVDPAARKAGQYRSEGFGVRIREGESVRTFPHGLWFEESPSMPDDGRCVWYASTKELALWIDYVKIAGCTVVCDLSAAGVTGRTALYFGSEVPNPSDQAKRATSPAVNGSFDAVRVTRRVLTADEMLFMDDNYLDGLKLSIR